MKITAIWKNSIEKPQRRALTLAFTVKAHGKMASAILLLTFQRTLKQPTVQQQNVNRNLCPSDHTMATWKANMWYIWIS